MKRREVLYAIKHPHSPEQLEHERYMADLHQMTRSQIKRRSLAVYTSLAAFYRKRANFDRANEKDTICVCDKEDFIAGLHDFNIHISPGVSLVRS
jgi:hypothetical protein